MNLAPFYFCLFMNMIAFSYSGSSLKYGNLEVEEKSVMCHAS